jgi:hypothetical protein
MNNLQYRRQFLLSPIECVKLKEWKFSRIGIYNLYVHPDTLLDTVVNEYKSIQLSLVGNIVNPHNPNESNSDILRNILQDISITTICEKLYHYAGRFVLIIKIDNEYYIFHDACGLKMVFYTKHENQLFAASQPLLLKEVIPLKEGDRYFQYQESDQKKMDIEFWIPSGCSLYEDVCHLVPNHYLDFSNFVQKRFWPNKKRQTIKLSEGIDKASSLLEKIMIAFNKRYKLALPLTAGFDSRTVLSATRPIAKDVFFYTLKYRSLTDESNDIKIPKQVLLHLGYVHNVIDCTTTLDEEFYEIYKSNSDMSHLDWGKIASGMKDKFPTDRVCIKGSCAEIARGGFYDSIFETKISNFNQVLNLYPSWIGINFIEKQLFDWFSETSLPEKNFGFGVATLFYWEHRMGSWQAQNQLEWDVVNDTLTPYNSRELLDILLSAKHMYRRWPNFKLFRKIIEKLWPEVLVTPINPGSYGLKRVVRFVKRKLAAYK